ncbi:MAG: hypothetical protein FJ098_06565 [Deltaproteobacteria bacterium]|nr:hypothetical protein [Deltaproteobacteria bacterium]
MLRLLLLLSLLAVVAWCLLAPATAPEGPGPAAPSLADPLRTSVDEGLRRSGDLALERVRSGLWRHGRQLDEARREAGDWIVERGLPAAEELVGGIADGPVSSPAREPDKGSGTRAAAR